MKGETTLDERVMERLLELERLRTFYKVTYPVLNRPEWPEHLVSQLIVDATYLATYYGLDLETIIAETVPDVRRYFPDIP